MVDRNGVVCLDNSTFLIMKQQQVIINFANEQQRKCFLKWFDEYGFGEFMYLSGGLNKKMVNNCRVNENDNLIDIK